MRKHSLSISWSRRTAGATGALVVVVIALVAVISAGSPSSSKGASTSGHQSGATTVEYHNLIATDTESGTLSYANPQTVYNRLEGTITWLPAVGQIVKPGGTLFDVDNAPVILFDGTTPAYRDLDSSDSDGPDILELNRDLKSMGYDPDNEITVNNEWQTGTTDAVERWQGSLDATETGTISLGQIVFLPGRQEIDTLDTTVGSTGSGTGDSNAAAGDTDYEPGTTHPQFASLTTSTTPATGATGATGASGPTSDATARDAADTCNGLDVQQNENGASQSKDTNSSDPSQSGESLPSCNQKGTTGATGPTGSKNPSQEAVLLALLKAETLELKKTLGESGTTGHGTTGTTTGGTGSGGREEGGGGTGGASSVGSGGSSDTGSGGSASGGDSGSAGAGATAILQTSSTNVIVSVPLPATNQSEAVVGEHVQVEMPAGSTVEGKITIVSPIATSSSASSGSGSSGSGSSGSGGSGSSGSSSATIPVTIALLSHHLPTTGLDQAAVSVNFAQEVRNHVLSVPVTALLATAGGGYAVQQAGSPHKLIPVTPGLFAAGDVQISGSGIYPGLQVTDSQG